MSNPLYEAGSGEYDDAYPGHDWRDLDPQLAPNAERLWEVDEQLRTLTAVVEAGGGGGGGGGTLSGEVAGPSDDTRITVRERAYRYVDPVNGDDANDGATPYRGYASMQYAYDTLKGAIEAGFSASDELGVGTIELLPGDHPVTADMSLDSFREAYWKGTRAGQETHLVNNNNANGTPSASRIVFSGAGVVNGIKISKGAGQHGHGHVFEDISFVLDRATAVNFQRGLYFVGIDCPRVSRCSFNTLDNLGNLDITFIDLESNGDSAWGTFEDIWFANGQLLRADGAGNGTNYNALSLRNIHGFYGSQNLPAIDLAGEVNGRLDNIYLEGKAIAMIRLGSADHAVDNLIMTGLFGEHADAATNETNPYLDFVNASHCQVYGLKCGTSAGHIGIAAKLASGCGANIFVGRFDRTGEAGLKTKVDDSAVTWPRHNWIFSTRHGLYMPVKTGAGTGALVTDADYTKTPDDSAWMPSYDTGSGVRRIFMKVGGAWRASDLNPVITAKQLNGTGGSDDTDRNSYTTGSFTPTAGKAWIVFVHSSQASADPPDCTVSGMGLTWTQLASLAYSTDGTSHRKIQLFKGVGTPSAGALTYSFGTTVTSCSSSVLELWDADPTNPIVVSNIVTGLDNGSHTSASLTLAAASDSRNRAIAAFGHNAAEVTSPRSGWDELADVQPPNPSSGFEVQWRADKFEAGASASWATSGKWGGIAAEIQVIAA